MDRDELKIMLQEIWDAGNFAEAEGYMHAILAAWDALTAERDAAIREVSALSHDVQDLTSHLNSVKEDNENIKKGKMFEEIMIDIRSGKMDVMLKSSLVPVIMEIFGRMFVESGADNFVAMQGLHPELGELEFIIQHKEGKPITEVLNALTARNALLEKVLENSDALMKDVAKRYEIDMYKKDPYQCPFFNAIYNSIEAAKEA